MNIFEQAIKSQIRFNLNGVVSVEQLYNARRTKDFKEALISYEETLTEEKEAFGKSTRRSAAAKSKAQAEVELRLTLVTNLLDEIEIAEKESAEEGKKAARRQELLALKVQKQSEKLASLSIEEIDAELAAL